MDRRFPSIDALLEHAKKRIPYFAWEYLDGGIGDDGGKRHNVQSLRQTKLLPVYLHHDGQKLDPSTTVLGQKFDYPFGVSPIGLGGLMWPKAAEYLAKSASSHNLPFCMSTFATATPEDIFACAGKNAWFQLYRPNDPDIREKMITRVEKAGFETLLLTVDIPAMTWRRREVAVGLALPPEINYRNVWQMMMRPRWCLETLLHEVPKFHLVDEYVPADFNRQGMAYFVNQMTKGHQSEENLKELRDRWKGKLLIKGLLAVEDVARCRELGYDGVVVSNHGGRQLQAAPSAADVLPALRREFPDYTLIADGGVRSGADVVTLMALGADLVLLGRAMMAGVCAAGQPGARHVMHILKQEFDCTMAQIGVTKVAQIPQTLHRSDS